MTSNRKEWIDILKCFGILSVIAGHIFPNRFFYVYHMPLFFILGGYLYHKPESKKKYFLIKSIHFIWPYVSFLVLLNVLVIGELLYECDYGGIKTLIYNDFYGGALLMSEFGTFWYVGVYFISQQLFNLIIEHKASKLYFFLFFIVSFFIPGFCVPLPYNIQVVPMATFLMWIGYLLQKADFKYLLNKKLLLASLIAIVTSYVFSDSLYIDMKKTYYGIPVVSILISIIDTIGFASISVHISFIETSIKKIFTIIGANTMCIMYLHQYVHFKLILLDNCWLIAFASLLIPLLFSYLCNKSRWMSSIFCPTNECLFIVEK